MKKILLFITLVIILASLLHAVTVTPGKTWVTGEDITATALNATAAPTVTLQPGDVTANIIGTNAIQSFHISNTVFEANFNFLINSNFDIWQRGTTYDTVLPYPNTNDAYIADRWILLSDGDDVVDVTRNNDVPAGSQYSSKWDVQTINKKFGLLQALESSDSLKLKNKRISLSCQARTESTEISNFRMAALSWTGSADLITSNPINTWQAAGTAPTLVANWIYEGNSQTNNLALTSSWQQFKAENILIDTLSVSNVAVFIWVDDDNAAANDTFYITQVQLELSEQVTEYAPKLLDREQVACLRWFHRVGDGLNVYPRMDFFVPSIGAGRLFVIGYAFPTKMRIGPSIDVRGTWVTDGFSNSVPTVAATANGFSFSGITDGSTAGNLRLSSNSADDVIDFDAGL